MLTWFEKYLLNIRAIRAFVLVVVAMVMIGIYVMQKAYPFTSEGMTHSPTKVLVSFFIIGVLLAYKLQQDDLARFVRFRWLFILIAGLIAYGSEDYSHRTVSSLYVIPKFIHGDVLACVLFFSGVALFSDIEKSGRFSKVALVISGCLLPFMFIYHSDLGVAIIYVILLASYLVIYNKRRVAFLIASSTLSLLVFCIASVPYRMNYIERVFWHSDPDSVNSIALKALFAGGLTGSSIPIHGLHRAEGVCHASSSASELILCMGDDGSFIFSIIGEWYGYIAIAAICMIIILYAFFSVIAFRRANSRRDALLVVAFSGVILLLAFLHILRNLGLFFWDVPLPFFDFSWAMLLIVCISVGLICKILTVAQDADLNAARKRSLKKVKPSLKKEPTNETAY